MSETPAIEIVLLATIADPNATRKNVATSYAAAIEAGQHYAIDWPKINKAIMERWSRSGLRWIKKQAWKGKA